MLSCSQTVSAIATCLIDSSSHWYRNLITMSKFPKPRELLLGDLREDLIRQEETIIFALIERAQFGVNPKVYAKDSGAGLGASEEFARANANGSFLDFMLMETEKLHSLVRRYTAPDEQAFFPEQLPKPILPTRLSAEMSLVPNSININRKIKAVYVNRILPQMCTTQDDKNYGSSAVTDIAALQALSKRIHYGKFIAEAKFQANEEKYSKLIAAHDAVGLMAELTKPTVEKQVLERVRLKASTYGSDPQQSSDKRDYKVAPDLIMQLYKDFVMPLTKEVQVAYLLQRLDHPTVAYVGEATAQDLNVPTAAQQTAVQCLVTPLPYMAATGGFAGHPCATATEVLDAVRTNQAQYGVVVFESTDLGTNQALQRTIIASDLVIAREIWRPVHCMAVGAVGVAWPPSPQGPASQSAGEWGNSWTVRGTRQALARIDTWIASIFSHGATVQQVVVRSDAEALSELRATGMQTQSDVARAIAVVDSVSNKHLERVGLKHLCDIQPDRASNDGTRGATWERSVVLQKTYGSASSSDQTAVAFTLDGSKPGELTQALSCFNTHRVNLQCIQSLAPAAQGGTTSASDAFCFYVVMDGHATDSNISSALADLKKLTPDTRVVGCYMLAEKSRELSTSGTLHLHRRNSLVDTSPPGADAPPSNAPDAKIMQDTSTCKGIAYLGPAATYSHQAALKIFDGLDIVTGPFVACGSIAATLAQVRAAEVDYAVVPVENSTNGSVSDTVDALAAATAAGCVVVSSFRLPIVHCLGTSAATLGEISEVHSKAQALAQCQQWLMSNVPTAKVVPSESTAAAVQHALAAKHGVAAIASHLACESQALPVLRAGVQDSPDNTTRFLVLASPGVAARGDSSGVFSASRAMVGGALEWRTCVQCTLRDGVSELAALLYPLSRRNMRVTWLAQTAASTPLGVGTHFLEFEGQCDDALMDEAMKELRSLVSSVRSVGSYPSA
eukprot:m.1409480 g.1409480  ORF g.1409480 m.1409480 type:complete len:959 (+) comp25022_c1_seq68:236-3112(+)